MGNRDRILSEARKLVGGIGKPRKMPGYAYGLSVETCRTGKMLRTVPGSVCYGCYAYGAGYRRSSVARAHAARLAAIVRSPKEWADRFVEILKKLKEVTPPEKRFFRWQDSGDVVNTEHFAAIVSIAERSPDWRFWLPTKERKTILDVMKFLPSQRLPVNLVVRLSAPNVGVAINPNRCDAVAGIAYSSAGSGIGTACNAPNTGGRCAACRACWDAAVINVDYKLHGPQRRKLEIIAASRRRGK